MKRILFVLSIVISLLLLTALYLSADSSQYISVTADTSGEYDLYKVPQSVSAGYRYGPSFIVNEDGSIDAWFASSGSSTEQWDWIMYKHYDGKSWSEEKCVLQPTPASLDQYSCCDPGVIYLDGYYYLTYTSTVNYNQTDNSLFVARSEKPDGPYEKWNGESWGGISPKPLVAFTEDSELWGIGEGSMTELDGTLYVYYTVSGSKGHSTALATADAADPNWPLTLEFQGYVLENTSSDAIDVKYSEEYKRFVAVASDRRMTEDSYLVFYESLDGLRFRISDICKKDIYEYCHNPGMSGDKRGHITADMECFVSYAYGREWSVWNTRLVPISISLSDNADRSEINRANRSITVFERDTRDPSTLDITGISPQTRNVIRASSSTSRITLRVNYTTAFRDKWKSIAAYSSEIVMYGYDTNIVRRIGSTMDLEVVGTGTTMITVDLRGHLTYIYVYIYDSSEAFDSVRLEPVGGTEINITDDLDGYDPQIKSILYYRDGSINYICGNEWGMLIYEYDDKAMSIDERGHITPYRTGSYTVKVGCEDKVYELIVNISKGKLDYKDFPDVRRTSWYYQGVRYCYENRYISGTDKGRFEPEGRLTREQFVVILTRIDKVKLKAYTTSPFTDVDPESWYGPSVIWAYNGGYVNGIGEGRFGVGNAMTRQELAVLLHRYSLDTVPALGRIYSYRDWGGVASWAVDSVNWAIEKGILGSTDTKSLVFSPKMTVTRAQAAKIFMTLCLDN